MSTIAILDLSPMGYDLFLDSESFMTDMNEDELGIQGGGFWATVGVVVTSAPSIAVSVAGLAVGSLIAWTVNRR
jgi:hypothetical protein